MTLESFQVSGNMCILFLWNGTENHKFNPSGILSFFQVESRHPSWLIVKPEEASCFHLMTASCHNEMLLYHLGWAPCCFNGQSNTGHKLFWREHKYYLIRNLGHLTSRQNTITALGLGPRCQSRCLRFYRSIIQSCAGWGWSRAKLWE